MESIALIFNLVIIVMFFVMFGSINQIKKNQKTLVKRITEILENQKIVNKELR